MLTNLNNLEPNNAIENPNLEAIDELLNLYQKGEYLSIIIQANVLADQYPKVCMVWKLIADSALQMGMFDKAIVAYNKVITLQPKDADAYLNIGVVFQNQGYLDKAILAYRTAVVLKPENAYAYFNIANVLKDQGKKQKAIEAYQKTISIKPNFADAYCNMGNVYRDKRKFDKAIESYNQALLYNPDLILAYNNMGLTFVDQGDFLKAIEVFKKAILYKPNYDDAYYNLSRVLLKLKRYEEGIFILNKKIALEPNDTKAYLILGNALKEISFKKTIPNLHENLIKLLEEKLFVRPINISEAIISLLKLEPSLKKYFQKSYFKKKQPFKKVFTNLSKQKLLLKFMGVCTITDIEIETFLKEQRARLLFSISTLKRSHEILSFQQALALQCFINEYIYTQSKKEKTAIKLLEEQVKYSLLNNKKPRPELILCLASYKSLEEYEWHNLLEITNEIEEVYIRQVDEPQKEKILRSNIRNLEEINDKISLKVKDQYEKNPYPRWINLAIPSESITISKVVENLNLKLFDNRIMKLRTPNVLIAGCGTGQQSIEAARRYMGAKVLGIDLSRTSLAYAKRKSDELGVKNIEYLQADILALDKLNIQFDIIESSGVLHHLHNPFKGFQVLSNCLKNGGLMRIGLYSEIARQHITEIRKEILKSGIRSDESNLKTFRLKVINSKNKYHKQILNEADFYSLSGVKDLLFHVQEQSFTISKIENYLKELGLKFCGFEGERIVSHFKKYYPHKEDYYRLDKWKQFEEANPKIFSGMYQFWCQKKC